MQDVIQICREAGIVRYIYIIKNFNRFKTEPLFADTQYGVLRAYLLFSSIRAEVLIDIYLHSPVSYTEDAMFLLIPAIKINKL
jgi:hypothetical protein